ncbi:alkaline phosphatase family protein [Chloroflexota bacterium]
MKTVVIGLDGACFELIAPWIESGYLPNIAKIKSEGVWADMESVLPPVTSPNWKCYSTGKNPGKLGIFWWQNVDWYNRKVYYPADRKFKNKEIWDYIGEAGMKVGVIGMPTTYPPKKVNGFLVSGGPDARESSFTYPPELEQELKKHGWQNHPQNRIDVNSKKASYEIHKIIDDHFTVAGTLSQKYNVDFLMVAVFRSNNLHHFLWDDPETKKAWQIIDKRIGQFMDRDCDLIIMSDHGSNKIKLVFNINSWLKEEGYLSFNNINIRPFLYKLGINRQSLVRIASKLRVLKLLRKTLSSSFYRNIPSESGEIKLDAMSKVINWQKSKAVASGQGPVYLNPENSNNDELRKEIKQKLEALADPSSGKKIIEKVYTKEEIYHGRYLAEAPDLIIDQAKGVHIAGRITPRGIIDSPQRWLAENKKTGLFMAYGPNIKRGAGINNVSILDLAPTILHLMGLEIPDDMDGRVLKEIFKKGSEPAERLVRKSSGLSEKERIQEKIEDLKKGGST